MTAMFSQWADVSAFLDMGGYGLYVWGSFGVTAAVMAAECLALRSRRLALRTVARPALPPADFEIATHEA